MKLFIHFSVIVLLLLALPLAHHSQLLTLEEDHDFHLSVKAEKKLPLTPFLNICQVIIILLVIESFGCRFLYFLSNYRQRFFSPVFYQGNYIATHSH
ncbi:hypothetical protein ACQKL5_01415 [Peribacillus sp. NPDC097675]|uniref:hypothetical protein n=1 Tax=Peribacillus sp. NPDC097675 TaxID=3390618 RepID=UPI003CFEE9A9